MNTIAENIQVDAEGYLTDANAWTPEVAEAIASQLNMTLTERHWVAINFARREFEANGEAPTLRRLTKSSGVDTKELYQIFPGGPAKLVAKLAGLKKPTGCI